MPGIVELQSNTPGELNKFLSEFYNTNMEIENIFKWKKIYSNPIEMSELIGAFIDNIETFNIKMWISLDKNIFIKVSEHNADTIIKYLFERYPY